VFAGILTSRGRSDRAVGYGQQPVATAAAEPIPRRRSCLRRVRMRSFLGSTVLPIRTTEALMTPVQEPNLSASVHIGGRRA
jgi:hypothetical protein